MSEVNQDYEGSVNVGPRVIPRDTIRNRMRADNGIFDTVDGYLLFDRARRQLGQFGVEIIPACTNLESDIACCNRYSFELYKLVDLVNENIIYEPP